MAMNLNSRAVTLRLTRGEVCKLLISMTAQYEADPEHRRQLYALHDKIGEQLAGHDRRWEEKMNDCSKD